MNSESVLSSDACGLAEVKSETSEISNEASQDVILLSDEMIELGECDIVPGYEKNDETLKVTDPDSCIKKESVSDNSFEKNAFESHIENESIVTLDIKSPGLDSVLNKNVMLEEPLNGIIEESPICNLEKNSIDNLEDSSIVKLEELSIDNLEEYPIDDLEEYPIGNVDRQISETSACSCNFSENNSCQKCNCANDIQVNSSASFMCDSSTSDSDCETELKKEYCDQEMAADELMKNDCNKKIGSKKENYEFMSTIKYYESQLEIVETTNKQLQLELVEMKNKLHAQEIERKRAETEVKAELLAKIERLSKECFTLRKEKETMVIRYANSEKEVILEKKAQNELEKRIKEINKEREGLLTKFKSLSIEKSRLSTALDNKMVEMAKFQRENEKLKEDFNSREIKIKWLQNKLKTEASSHKETQVKLEHNLQRLNEMREEAEQVRRDCQEMIKCYQEAEEIKSVKLDCQLKQKLSELEVQRQERSDQEQVYQLLRQELEALKKKQRITIEENNCLTVKIHSLEKERLEYEQTLSKLKDNQNLLKQEVVDLAAKLAEMENLKLQLEREREKSAANLREVDRLRSTNAELQSDMDACHEKEGELLEFTERLTAKTVQLQSDHSLLEIKAQALEEENSQVNKQYSELQLKFMDLSSSYEYLQKEKQEETQLLARKLAEITKNVEQLNIKLDEAENENRVMKKRHIASIKELSRELYSCKKRLDNQESPNCAPEESTSLGSRASSTMSLDILPPCSPAGNNLAPENVSPPVVFSGRKATNNPQEKKPAVLVSAVPDEVDKKTLIERIIKLQKMLARKNDKIEFLEDHTEQLVREMKKKTKIIQNYVVKGEVGALITNASDQNKLELSKRGGIMASVYTSQLSDNNMTLELSLEINQKLQAVLEDTLLKNITLKENVSTLGEEIARLTSEQRQFSKQLKKQKSFK